MFPGDIYGDQANFGRLYTPYSDDYEDPGNADHVYVKPRGDDWAQGGYFEDPYRLPEGRDRYLRQVPSGWGQYSEPPAQAADYSWDEGGRMGRLGVRGYAYEDGIGWLGEPSSAPPSRRYRFRGDEASDHAGQGAIPWRYGYRFRPLTEQEHQRVGAGIGWRPQVENAVRERPLWSDPRPSDEAYGYRPDSWFRRYYEEQP